METTMWYDHAYMEKRQMFLRSYQFSRKQTAAERIRRSFTRFRRIVRLRFRAIRGARRVVWSGLRRHLTCCGCRSFRRLSRSNYFGGGGGGLESSAARDWFGTPCRWAWAARKDYQSAARSKGYGYHTEHGRTGKLERSRDVQTWRG